MSSSDLSARPVVRLDAEDVRRLPMIGIALGIAIAATALSAMESGIVTTIVVVCAWAAVVGVLLAVAPAANALTLRPDGFRVRLFGLLGGFVPWSEVEAVESVEGWAGATVVVRLREAAAARAVPGLPKDPELGFHTLTDSYGRDADELAREMERRRIAAAHP